MTITSVMDQPMTLGKNKYMMDQLILYQLINKLEIMTSKEFEKARRNSSLFMELRL